ncbi:hypothetical protein QVD17_02724 [Tagetes erecta]|uniref:RBR-type E3 ubiquitin transferase n=1 Tax=Tagetes erecta TaxID=13708 RepID=A0AAD8L749_TARER|nr:hypothetical protein QVD17_02724 [Tagetes erecta]
MAGCSRSIHYIDELYRRHDDDIYPITDDKYAEDLQLQEALIGSSSSSSSSSHSPSSSSLKLKQPFVASYESKPPTITSFCGICMDRKEPSEMFQKRMVCGHFFCIDCIRGHVAAKMQANQIRLTCPYPNCRVFIGPDVCRSVVPTQVLERWERVLCETLIMHKFYCPFKDCSAMLVNDSGVTVTSSECPNCNRLFCAQCEVAWHCGMNCDEFMSLKKGDQSTYDMLIDFAKKNKWKSVQSVSFLLKKFLVAGAYLAGVGVAFVIGVESLLTEEQLDHCT